MELDIKQALQTLKNGGVILYPTDTIWGIGCDATNVEAVKRIYTIKQRLDSKSMLVLLDNPSYLSFYINEVPEIAYELIEVADKPLTIIYPGAKNLASNLIASDGSIGIRIPNDDFCKPLISRLRKPIVSTSANISGQPSPAIFSDISQEIIDAVDYVVTWRQNDYTKSQPSSIIKLGTKGEIEIIRK
jgi:L-threonylcarbamoyladenylate synthase